jgi:two-component system, LuxR family, sensor kinase FixL
MIEVSGGTMNKKGTTSKRSPARSAPSRQVRKPAAKRTGRSHGSSPKAPAARTAGLGPADAGAEGRLKPSKRAWTAREMETEYRRLAALVDCSSDAITAATLDGTITYWNQGAERLYGYTARQVLGRPFDFHIPSNRQKEFSRIQNRLLGGEEIAPIETVRLHETGRPVQVALAVSPILDTDGRVVGISGIARDITERKRLEAEILRVSEREQRRIAQDLQEGLGQELAGLACLSRVLESNLAEQSSPETGSAKKIARLLSAAVSRTRRLARGLYPVEAQSEGLMSALRDLAARTRELFKVACRFQCAKPVLIENNTVATHLYRVAQEAVTNALQHGRAKRVDIGLSATPRRVMLAIRDDGLGLSRLGGVEKGMGLRIMDYRAGMINGILVRQSRPEGGTEILLTADLAAPEFTPQMVYG